MTEIEIIKTYLNEKCSILDICTYLSGLFIFVFCLIHLKKSTIGYEKLLFYYSILVLAIELISFYTAAHKINNHYFYLVFYMLESIIFIKYYAKAFANKNFNKISLFIIGLFCGLIVYNVFFGKKLMNNYSITTISAIFIFISIYAYYQILSKLNIRNLFSSTLFWFNTANIFYFSGRIFTFLFIYEIMIPTKTNPVYLWDIVSFVLIIHRLILCIGIMKIEFIPQKSSNISF